MGIPVKGYSRYTIDENGRVFSTITKRELHPGPANNGYMGIELVGDNGVPKRLLLHRLVAMAFIPNPEGYPIINHKDENRQNNHVSNLEWCTYKYNSNYGTAGERREKALEAFRKSERIKETARKNGMAVCRPVVQLTRAGEFVAEYSSIIAATRALGVSGTKICEVCKGKRKSAGGFVWAYREE